MSTFKVEVCEIASITPHPNADRLEIATLPGKDWNVVVQKDRYKIGSKVIYFPVDSILPEAIESIIFPIDSKIKLANSRVKTIKLRGAISQGMVVDPILLKLEKINIGTDVTALLGVLKYEPPETHQGASTQGKTVRHKHPSFHKYGGLENAKNYNTIFIEGEEVIVSEKIHGSHIRMMSAPFYANTLLKKLKKFLRLAPAYEFVYGSNNVELTNKLLYSGFYKTNIYAEMVHKYQLQDKIPPNVALHGEVIGDGVQKGYTYGCASGERRVVFFDVKVDGKYLDPIAAEHFILSLGLEFVPVLYRGPFNKEKILSLTKGDSVYCKTQKIREGVVVKPIQESSCFIGRKVLKYISDNYLLNNQDDESIGH